MDTLIHQWLLFLATSSLSGNMLGQDQGVRSSESSSFLHALKEEMRSPLDAAGICLSMAVFNMDHWRDMAGHMEGHSKNALLVQNQKCTSHFRLWEQGATATNHLEMLVKGNPSCDHLVMKN